MRWTILIIVLIMAASMIFCARRRHCRNCKSRAINELYKRAQQIYNELNYRVAHTNEPSPSHILPFMFIGDIHDARSNEKITQLGITHILNCADLPGLAAPLYRDVDVKYLGLPIVDHPFFDIAQYFDQACKFIDSARKSGGKVLVHCQAGVSRSATMATEYICRAYNMPVYDALQFVKTRRRRICPNVGFIEQMLEDETMR